MTDLDELVDESIVENATDAEYALIDNDSCTISYHALNGFHIPRALRFSGQINQKLLMVLVDLGSTHNFIQTQIATQMGLIV